MEFKAKIVASLDLKALRAALKLKSTILQLMRLGIIHDRCVVINCKSQSTTIMQP